MGEDSSRIYIAIDLKSFYASVECVDRHLDPLQTNLVVADTSRTEKTICLAVSPSLKACGIPGRPRLFEVVQKVREINGLRLRNAPGRRFRGASVHSMQLSADPSLELAYIKARPRMARYLDVSAQVYRVYLRYVAPEDVHIYSVDEVFIDATQYVRLYRTDARSLAMRMIQDVLKTTGITATGGIGPNLYLAKIAMDIVAKHIPADKDGVRIAELDEASYRRQLWSHRPLTDFWRLGAGYARRLESCGMYTMGDVARMSHCNEELLYRLFGINAELLIDHAWGWEPCTIAAIKAYRPQSNSLSSGQVLQDPYESAQARLVVREMTDLLALDLVEKRLLADQLVLAIGYDVENLSDPARRQNFHGQVHIDHYGRAVPQSAHGSINLKRMTSSSRMMTEAAMELFDQIVNPQLLVRRINVTANHVIPEESLKECRQPRQLELFGPAPEESARNAAEDESLAREKRQQQALIAIKRKLGKNAILKGMNLDEGATARQRNQQIGGHRA